MVVESSKILEKKAIYNLEELTPSGEQVLHLYPDLVKCQGCNTCTMSCSQDLKVIEYISSVLYGKIAEVADKSFDCAMCSHCADKCLAGLAPQNIALLCRRLYGRYLVPRSRGLESRVSEIKGGKFDSELLELKKMGESELRRRYGQRDIEP
jgi:heterodisulfide reductase subunit C